MEQALKLPGVLPQQPIRVVAALSLLKELRSIGIHPSASMTAVRFYQRRTLRQMLARDFSWQSTSWRSIFAWLLSAGISFSVVSAATGGLAPCVLLGFAVAGIGAEFFHRIQGRRYANWERTPWLEFRGEIPNAVKERIGRVETLPGVHVEIESLYKDPFAIAVRGRERVCVGAWDCPNFVA